MSKELDELQNRVDDIQAELDMLRGNSRITIQQFSSGYQGELMTLGTIRTKIHRATVKFPEKIACSSLPLRSQEYHWIEIDGLEWPVYKTKHDDKLVWSLIVNSDVNKYGLNIKELPFEK